jgi:hypothetical protein
MYLLVIVYIGITPPVFQEFQTLEGCEKFKASYISHVKNTRNANLPEIIYCEKKD